MDVAIFSKMYRMALPKSNFNVLNALVHYLLYKLSSLRDDIVTGLLPDQCITKQFQEELSLFLQTHPIWRFQAEGQE